MRIQRIINSVFTSNTFVLTEDDLPYCWLVDVGDVEPIIDIVGNRELKGILLTHTHYDHIYGINKIVERFPDSVVYTSIDGKDGLFSDKHNFSKYHNDSIIFQGEHIHVLENGEEMQLFPNVSMKTIYTPGHDKSCVTYYTEDDIFTGDSYIPGIKVITTFPRSNKDDAEKSLNIIMNLITKRNIYPGHNDCVFINEETNIL